MLCSMIIVLSKAIHTMTSSSLNNNSLDPGQAVIATLTASKGVMKVDYTVKVCDFELPLSPMFA